MLDEREHLTFSEFSVQRLERSPHNARSRFVLQVAANVFDVIQGCRTIGRDGKEVFITK